MHDTMPTSHLYTVTGPVNPAAVGTIDGHTHTWIDPVGAVAPESPVLNSGPVMRNWLRAFRAAGGSALIDCQPGGCGRNGEQMLLLSEATGVRIVAATGFHLRRYYPPDTALFNASIEAASRHFIGELTGSLQEMHASPRARLVQAGFIKIACEATLNQSPLNLVEAAVQASLETGSAIEVHTEKGAEAEHIARFMLDAGLPARKLILCHVDKRPDFEFHRSLAQAGIGLEYDTFFRPKYQPDENVWPLLERMIGAGLEDSIIVATDRAEPQMWQGAAAGTGPDGLLTSIIPRLAAMGVPSNAIHKLTGLNVANRLARLPKEPTA